MKGKVDEEFEKMKEYVSGQKPDLSLHDGERIRERAYCSRCLEIKDAMYVYTQDGPRGGFWLCENCLNILLKKFDNPDLFLPVAFPLKTHGEVRAESSITLNTEVKK